MESKVGGGLIAVGVVSKDINLPKESADVYRSSSFTVHSATRRHSRVLSTHPLNVKQTSCDFLGSQISHGHNTIRRAYHLYLLSIKIKPSTMTRKKARGRASRRCLRCNRKSTVWRKGPGGSATLCNPCGVEYFRASRSHESMSRYRKRLREDWGLGVAADGSYVQIPHTLDDIEEEDSFDVDSSSLLSPTASSELCQSWNSTPRSQDVDSEFTIHSFEEEWTDSFIEDEVTVAPDGTEMMPLMLPEKVEVLVWDDKQFKDELFLSSESLDDETSNDYPASHFISNEMNRSCDLLVQDC
ncbi:hypothetical protein PROFUN_00798 [Planoprotostelium fungivorum]|uniref:GATA-type domain-containing protein n=1 Tax=Planoprotostelium fungivorum TaxID=1890364 RepID=A0A2P6P015_9EUKA|nr:hypothetical protein PROFUN_00798 [Planoprotostelium fungivorum]